MPTFPTTLRPPLANEPRILTLIGKHKIRKTLTCSRLADSLMLVTDPRGSDYIECRAFDLRTEAVKDFEAKVWTPNHAGSTVAPALRNDPIAAPCLLDYLEHSVIPALRKDRPARRIVVDTIDEIEDWILEDVNSRRQTLLLGGGKDKAGPIDSVIELGFGVGHNLIAESFMRIWTKLTLCADQVIFLCHSTKAFDPTDPEGKSKDASSDIDLRGKVKKIPCKQSDAIGVLDQRKPSPSCQQLWVSFRAGNDPATGNRILRLEGRSLMLSECKFVADVRTGAPVIDPKTNEPVVESFKTFWETIYTSIGDVR